MEEFNVEFYKTADLSCPIEDFLDTLDYKMRAKMLRMIALLKKHGNELREPYSKPVEDGIFELRAQQGSNIIRSFYFFLVGKQIIITNGFVKKTQKTPKNELIKAKQYREDYLKRKGSLS